MYDKLVIQMKYKACYVGYNLIKKVLDQAFEVVLLAADHLLVLLVAGLIVFGCSKSAIISFSRTAFDNHFGKNTIRYYQRQHEIKEALYYIIFKNRLRHGIRSCFVIR